MIDYGFSTTTTTNDTNSQEITNTTNNQEEKNKIQIKADESKPISISVANLTDNRSKRRKRAALKKRPISSKRPDMSENLLRVSVYYNSLNVKDISTKKVYDVSKSDNSTKLISTFTEQHHLEFSWRSFISLPRNFLCNAWRIV